MVQASNWLEVAISSYGGASIICYFVLFIREVGFFAMPGTVFKTVWKDLKTFLRVFVAGAILATFLVVIGPQIGLSETLIVVLANVIIYTTFAMLAVLMHRVVLSKVAQKRSWNIAILSLSLAMFVAAGLIFDRLGPQSPIPIL